jgi:hypothetical protein
MKKIGLIILMVLSMAAAIHAANTVTIDGVSKDGINIVITTSTPPPVIPPVIPPVVPPVIPPIVPPTPPGQEWPWDTYPTFSLGVGGEKIFVVNINRQLTYLKFSIAGLNETTIGIFSWTFPDGRVFPQALNQGVVDIQGMNYGGLLVLRSGAYAWGPNISDQYIPQGNHILRIRANANSSYFKAMIDAY